MTDPIVTLWTAQASDARGLSAAELTERARLFRRRLWRRDLVEYAAGLLVLPVFIWFGWIANHTGVRIACATIVAGTLVVMWNLWRRRPGGAPDALATDASSHYRAQLVAQRDALASIGRWYLGPFIPGLALFVIATTHASAQAMPTGAALVVGGLAALIIGGTFWGVRTLNHRAARAIETEIAAIDADRQSAILR